MLKEVPPRHYSNASQLHPENKRRQKEWEEKKQCSTVRGNWARRLADCLITSFTTN